MTGLLLVLLSTQCGCLNGVELTPRDKLVMAYDTYTTTVDLLVIARDEGKFSESERLEITSNLELALGLLEDWQRAVDTGKDPSVSAARLAALLDRLAALLEGK